MRCVVWCVNDVQCVDHDGPLGCRPCEPLAQPRPSARQDHTAPVHACPWARVWSNGPSHVTHEDRTAHARRVRTATACTSHTASSGGLWHLDMHNLTTSLGLGRAHRVAKYEGNKSSLARCTDLRRFAAFGAGTCGRVNTATRQPHGPAYSRLENA